MKRICSGISYLPLQDNLGILRERLAQRNASATAIPATDRPHGFGG
jgi:hypothetical protein